MWVYIFISLVRCNGFEWQKCTIKMHANAVVIDIWGSCPIHTEVPITINTQSGIT